MLRCHGCKLSLISSEAADAAVLAAVRTVPNKHHELWSTDSYSVGLCHAQLDLSIMVMKRYVLVKWFHTTLRTEFLLGFGGSFLENEDNRCIGRQCNETNTHCHSSYGLCSPWHGLLTVYAVT